MRFLLTFLFCYSFTIAAKANSPIYKTQQKKTNHTFLFKTATLSKKLNQNSCKKDYPNFFDRIHHHINHISDLAISSIHKSFQLTSSQINFVKNKLVKHNFSYHFIFKCLYPKHTFW
jgi:hypothetical protein